MPPKLKTPAPIDRPLSRAYLRGFTGWSTAFPPGHSEPTSLRLMKNMVVDRNGALAVRPGMRYVSYQAAPDLDPMTDAVEGIAYDRPLVGSQEPFYVEGGRRALLFAVRETDGTVGFRALLFTDAASLVKPLTDVEIGFTYPQGEATVRFSAATTHVEYLQIDNKIVAMSDAGEDIRMFFVGAEKVAKRMTNVTVPQWEDSHKLTVVHPDSTWITKQGTTSRRNELFNPSFEVGGEHWGKSSNAAWRTVAGGVSGTRALELKSLPSRTNMQTSPLHDAASTGIGGWYPHKKWGNPKLTRDGSYLKVYESKEKGTFLAYGAKLSYGVTAGQKYRVALDYDLGTHVEPITVLTFYNAAGVKIGNSTSLEMPRKAGRYSSPAVTAPANTVTMRVSVGGRNEKSSSTFVKVKNIVLCKDGESTAMFHGGSGTNYFWAGTPNASASVYHPPVLVSLVSRKTSIRGGSPFITSIHALASVSKAFTLRTRSYDKASTQIGSFSAAGTAGAAWTRASAGTATSPTEAVLADLYVEATLARGEALYLDAGMIESGASVVGTYFDGTTAGSATVKNQWANLNTPHRCASVQIITVDPRVIPAPETPTANTLIASGGATSNTYKIGFFYTFENEVGESAPSKVTEVRTKRPWSNWIWETANASGEPSGTSTQTAALCADQLVAYMSSTVYNQAVAEGAIRWNLYAFAWSDQEPVPVVAQLVGTIELYPDEQAAVRAPAQTYDQGGWIQVTPARRIGINDTVLPTPVNRVNYSDPPQSRTGLVAGDRIILLGDPTALATIRWSSNRPGEYTNFTSSRGGGSKTLTTGNLNVPAAVALWQNPQSVDTLTVLCMSGDGRSVSYYMMPATVNQQTASSQIMGFEETTNSPGTVAPYGAEVINNALYRPLDRALLKSTAANYNINHTTVSTKIANMWHALRNKEWIMSAQLDNRLYFLVHNPYGEILESGCKGNEIWVFDVEAENGHWSRCLVQAACLRVFTIGPREVLGITRPDGLFYFDFNARLDDWVDVTDGLKVKQRAIPWSFETNTQGANKAHDAWAHLQQVQVTLGNFYGTMRYGIRGKDVNGMDVEFVKEMQDLRAIDDDGMPWDIDDILQVRRDLKEWFLFGTSIEDKDSSGQFEVVQYRYTPVSVNVGYEFGSIETFEYGANVAEGPTIYSDNGIPLPYLDYSRP